MNTGAGKSPWGLCCGGTGGQTGTAVSAPPPQPPGGPHTQRGLTWVCLGPLGLRCGRVSTLGHWVTSHQPRGRCTQTSSPQEIGTWLPP